LNIAQKSARMEVAFDKTSVVPGEEIAFVPTLFDMANDEIKDKILVKITSVDQRTYFEGYVESGLNHTIKTEKDYLPGYASIKLQSEEIIVKKSFEIKELKKINTEIINKTLVITNVGNVPYNGLIEVSIGNSTLLEEVNLALGERKEFYLSAPEGVYEISVKDDNDIFQHSGISLTGSAINVNEVGKKIFSSYPIAWTFIILVLILFSYIFVKKYLRNKRMHFNEFKKEQISGNEYFKKKDSIKVITPEKTKKDVEEIILSNNEIRKARYELVMQGKKQEAGLISLKIKSSLSGIEKDTFNQAM
jgi:hypothetical protein